MTKNRSKRRSEILTAVLELLREGGVEKTSTARIASRAHCSKETLYSWFGDRDGIFAALVEAQSAQLNEMLSRHLETDDDPWEALISAGAALLDLLTGTASLAINRAAMSDGSGKLGELLRAHGRGRSAPGFMALITELQATEKLGPGEPAEIFSVLQGLLMGDRQIRALLGDTKARPKPAEFLPLARKACLQLQAVFPVTTTMQGG